MNTTSICSNLTRRRFHPQNIECNLLDVTWEPLKLFSLIENGLLIYFLFLYIIAFDTLSTRKMSQPQTMLRPTITHGINNLGLQWFLCCRYRKFSYLFHSHNIDWNYYQKNNCVTIGLIAPTKTLKRVKPTIYRPNCYGPNCHE